MNEKKQEKGMQMKTIKTTYIFIIIFLLNHISYAQISQGGQPYSFSHQMAQPKMVTIDEQQVDISILSKDCDAMTFAQFLPVGITLKDDVWQKTKTNDGRMVYRLAIKSANAQAVGAYLSEVFIPQGAELFIYSPDHKQLIGAFTSFNNHASALLPTEYIIGQELVIEYIEPIAVVGEGKFIVNELLYAFRGIQTFDEAKGFGGSGDCEVNVNCPEGENKSKQRDAVVRILIKTGGMGIWCTGSLVNNTNQDRTAYVLTADHCGENSSVSEHHEWIFYFNYQSLGCDDPNEEPEHQSMVGCAEIASSSKANILGSDFYLVLLENEIPEDYNPYFIGWNRSGSGSDLGYGIHHPQGDIKKISHYTQTLVDATYSSGIQDAYWEVKWSETESGYGVTEGGSSGSPIFDENGYLIGTLTGGQASCNNQTGPDYYGKIDIHWEGNGSEADQQLAPWLDPNGTGQTYLGGVYLGSEELEIPLEDVFICYPNPVFDKLSIHFKNPKNSHQIDIYDISGRVIQSQKYQGMGDRKISMTGIAKGVYLLKINDGNKTQITKVLKN